MSNDFERYAAKLRRIDPAVRAVQPRAAKEGALIVKREVEARVPVDEGDMKKTVGDKPVDRTSTSATHQVHVGIFYAPFVERGHGGPHPARAHPFFRPALDHKEQEATKKMVEIQNNALKGAMR